MTECRWLHDQYNCECLCYGCKHHCSAHWDPSVFRQFEGGSALTHDERLAWCAWFRTVGIDPTDVTMDGFVERDLVGNQVHTECYARTDGKLTKNPEGTDAVRTIRTVQLDYTPPEFPVL